MNNYGIPTFFDSMFSLKTIIIKKEKNYLFSTEKPAIYQYSDIFIMGEDDVIHIAIETENLAVVIHINQILDPLIIYIGKRFLHNKDYASLPGFDTQQLNGDYTGLYSSAYTTSGTRNLLEPAIHINRKNPMILH